MQLLLRSSLFLSLALLICSCEKTDTPDLTISAENLALKADSFAKAAPKGATQIDGVGIFPTEADCDVAGESADYALLLDGDLQGCLYVFVEEFGCSPSGTYRESGTEYFVGTYQGEFGTFWTDYFFSSKYEGCAEDGLFLGAEIFGRCQHPIIRDSGTGTFEGVSGRLDFKDDVETATFPYRGHLRY
ncbi:MAG: hypothetical protein WA952_20030 [Lewinella sp.]